MYSSTTTYHAVDPRTGQVSPVQMVTAGQSHSVAWHNALAIATGTLGLR